MIFVTLTLNIVIHAGLLWGYLTKLAVAIIMRNPWALGAC